MVAPTYNNGETVSHVIESLLGAGHRVFVINDGCTDSTAALLEALETDARDDAGSHALTVLTHPSNRGKAAALRAGFEAARRAGFTHAVTIDTDSQHDPAETPRLIALSREHPEALIIGSRDVPLKNYPWPSLVGRWVSNALLWLESGVWVSDSQSGFRVYPLCLPWRLWTEHCLTQRFIYETEVIAKAGWARVPVHECTVTSLYLPPERRVSHFRPWVDSFRSVGLHFKLIAGCRGLWWRWRHGQRGDDAPTADPNPKDAENASPASNSPIDAAGQTSTER